MSLQVAYEILLPAVYVYGVLTLFATMFISAPYGRHVREGWGPTLPAKTAWPLMEFPAFGLVLAFFFMSNSPRNPVLWVFFLLWEAHYLHRTFVYPLLLPRPKKPFPWIVVLMGFLFNGMNGFLIGTYLFMGGDSYAASWFSSPHFLLGIVLFVAGAGVNLQSDSILRRLNAGTKRTAPPRAAVEMSSPEASASSEVRNVSEKKTPPPRTPSACGPGDLPTLRTEDPPALEPETNGEYRIPRQGLFRWISCPNYLGEILEWTGFALMTCAPPAIAFAFFTFCNLAPRAVTHHRWYRERFSNYPRNRRALVPFLL